MQDAYDGENRKDSLSEKKLDELDSDLLVPVLLNYQMSMMNEDTFRQMLAQQQTDPNAEAQMEQMSVEEIGAMMGVELKPFQRTEEDDDGNETTVTCVDVRPVFAAMQQSGQLTEEIVNQMRSQLEDMLDTMGDSLVKSMGVAYAVQCDKDAGLDVDKIQTSYLWRTGGKMMAMAFAMMLRRSASAILHPVWVQAWDVISVEECSSVSCSSPVRRWISSPPHLSSPAVPTISSRCRW